MHGHGVRASDSTLSERLGDVTRDRRRLPRAAGFRSFDLQCLSLTRDSFRPSLLVMLGNRPFMIGQRSWDDWIRQYSGSHQHPVNRICHTFGIPLIVLSLALFAVAIFVRGFWPVPLAIFLLGWVLQFVGHWFEGKPPEFFSDWRFLLVGTRWWVAKIRGRV